MFARNIVISFKIQLAEGQYAKINFGIVWANDLFYFSSGKARFHSLITMAAIFDPFDKLKKTIERAGDISDRSTCAANTTAIGEGTKEAFAGRKATFTIFSRDSQDRQRNQGGDVYAVKLAERGFEIRNVHVKDQKDGTYSVEYFVGNLLGKLTLSMYLRGETHQKQPFFCTS